MSSADSRPIGLFAVAAVPGVIHAAASLYWSLGGSWLLETVGEGAVELQRDAPLVAAAVLLPVALLKLAGVAVPMLNQRGRLPKPRLWRALTWVAAVSLVAYGGLYTVLAVASLGGAFGPVDDPTGMRGHAFLWDPLFAIWGLLLVAALARSRPGRAGAADAGDRGRP